MDKNVIRGEIIDFCNKYGIRRYTIGEDVQGLYIDVDSHVILAYCSLEYIPIRFGHVSGIFYCGYNELLSLKGCPMVVGGNFHCNNNKLTSLEYCPIWIGESFYCYDNPLDITSFYHSFELGYDLSNIISNIDLVSMYRQWILKSIINGE
jgi:hypothetical protein